MTSNDEKDLQNLTKITAEQQKKLLKLFAKLTAMQKKQIFSNQRTIFHKLKNLNEKSFDNETLTLASHIIAISQYANSLNDHELKVIKYNEKKANKDNKTKKLLVIWSIVKDLKENKNMSFREIADFITDTRFEVSYSLVFKEWQKFEKKEILC